MLCKKNLKNEKIRALYLVDVVDHTDYVTGILTDEGMECTISYDC